MSFLQPITLVALACCVFGGCSRDLPPIPGTTDKIHLQDSPSYDQAIRSFRIRPSQAVELLNAAFHETAMEQLPAAVVGRWYLFSFPVHRAILLNGYYVNGDTGQVEYREPPYEVGALLLFVPHIQKNNGYGGDYVVWEHFVANAEGKRPNARDLAGATNCETPYYLNYPVRGRSDYPYYVDEGHHKPDGLLPQGTAFAALEQKRNYLRVWTADGNVRAWILVNDVRRVE